MSPVKRITLAASVLLAALLSNVWLWQQHQPLPEIQGVYLPTAKSLAEFELLDHHQQPFQPEHLQGQWHLLAYGFTHCPDFCPTLLHELVALERQLQQRPESLQILFYSVDTQRDTPTELAQYLTYFSDNFIGLSSSEDVTASERFEKSLGIVYQLQPITASSPPEESQNAIAGDYSVAHGTALYLLNPQGQLQAVLQPATSPSGIARFNAEQLLQDYLRIRHHSHNARPNNTVAQAHQH